MAQPMQHYRVRAAHCEGGTFTLTHDRRRYIFPDGLVVRSSDTCDPDGGVANLGGSPPLVRCWVIERFSDIFEPMPDPAPPAGETEE